MKLLLAGILLSLSVFAAEPSSDGEIAIDSHGCSIQGRGEYSCEWRGHRYYYLDIGGCSVTCLDTQLPVCRGTYCIAGQGYDSSCRCQ